MLEELKKQEREFLIGYSNSDDPFDQIYYWNLAMEVAEKIRELELEEQNKN